MKAEAVLADLEAELPEVARLIEDEHFDNQAEGPDWVSPEERALEGELDARTKAHQTLERIVWLERVDLQRRALELKFQVLETARELKWARLATWSPEELFRQFHS